MKGRVVPVESGQGRRSNTGEPTAACDAEPTRGIQPFGSRWILQSVEAGLEVLEVRLLARF